MKTISKNKPYRIKGAGLRNLFESVLIRDNYTCRNPFCKNGYPLDIPHHVIFKSQSGPDTMDNLVTVCIYCHDDLHRRRVYCQRIEKEFVFSEERISPD